MFDFLTHQATVLLETYGYVAVLLCVAIEGIGIPLPGETMLVAAAIYAGSTQRLNIALVIAAAMAGAALGAVAGYWIGRIGGYRLVRRYGKHIRLDARRMRLGQYLFRRHGGMVIFFGRFVTILRAWAAFLAGVNLMPWWRFAAFSAAGAILWATAYGVGAYWLGSALLRFSRPVDVAIAVLAVLGIAGFIVFMHRNEARLQAEADRTMAA